MSKPLGATGDFPQGKLNPADEGGIRIAVQTLPGKVVIDFGKQVAWIGFGPTDARALAESLIRAAKIAEHGNG